MHGAGDPGEERPVEVLDGARPEAWVADLYGSQRGRGWRGQLRLTDQLRDVRYAVDAGARYSPQQCCNG